MLTWLQVLALVALLVSVVCTCISMGLIVYATHLLRKAKKTVDKASMLLMRKIDDDPSIH